VVNILFLLIFYSIFVILDSSRFDDFYGVEVGEVFSFWRKYSFYPDTTIPIFSS
jgi:hypothetical protein